MFSFIYLQYIFQSNAALLEFGHFLQYLLIAPPQSRSTVYQRGGQRKLFAANKFELSLAPHGRVMRCNQNSLAKTYRFVRRMSHAM